MESKPPFLDLHDLEEDERIAMIGHMVRDHGKTVSVCIDNISSKIDRYKRKVKERFPEVIILAEHTLNDQVYVVKYGPQ